MESLRDELKALLDPNAFSEDGTVALTGASVSEDGRFLAYDLSASGSDWQDWRIREVDTGKDLDDHLRWAKNTSASWTHVGGGFVTGFALARVIRLRLRRRQVHFNLEDYR